jgi:hypothetical protein
MFRICKVPDNHVPGNTTAILVFDVLGRSKLPSVAGI